MLLFIQTYRGSEVASMPRGMTIPNLFSLLPYIYVIGVIFWFVPYTLLALGLLVWSPHKRINTLLLVFALSPLLMTALMLLEINILSIVTQDVTYSLADSNVRNLMALNQLVIFATLVAGYFCVGLGFGIYKIFQSLNLIKETGLEVGPLTKEAV